MSRLYKIPISWASFKRIDVEADNLQSAIYLALKQFLSEPDDSYLDDSFQFDEDYIEENYPKEDYNLQQIYNSL